MKHRVDKNVKRILGDGWQRLRPQVMIAGSTTTDNEKDKVEMKAKTFLALLFFALALAGAGCSTTHVTSVWKADQVAGGTMKVIMVVGVAERSVGRQEFEESMAKRLRAGGVEAVPSIEVLPTDKELTREVVENAVRRTNIDGVLVARIIEKEETTTPVEDTKYYDFTKKYVYNATDKQFYADYLTVKAEITLYETKQGAAIWSIKTLTHGPNSPEYLMNSVIAAVMDALRKTNLLAKQR